jgi:hypothetical protein
MVPDGTISIAEFVVDGDRRGPMNGLIFAVNMLVNTESGNTYSGFTNRRQLPGPGPSPLILAMRDGSALFAKKLRR